MTRRSVGVGGARPATLSTVPRDQADDVELAVGVDAERADVAELRLAAELRGVLDETRGARLALAVDRQRDRPDPALDVVGEEVAAAYAAPSARPR